MKTDFIELIINGEIATICLCNRAKRNALSAEMVNDLNKCVDYINHDCSIKVCILRGESDFFCAGADIGELNKITNVNQRVISLMDNWREFANLKIPVIACVAGYALGGGFELALMCDLIVASENAVFGFPEVNIGLLPGNGGTQRLPALIGVKRAFEMISTGVTIDAKTAYEYGIVNKVAPLSMEGSVAYEMARKLTEKPAASLIAIKSVMRQYASSRGLECERDVFSRLLVGEDKMRLTSEFCASKMKS